MVSLTKTPLGVCTFKGSNTTTQSLNLAILHGWLEQPIIFHQFKNNDIDFNGFCNFQITTLRHMPNSWSFLFEQHFYKYLSCPHYNSLQVISLRISNNIPLTLFKLKDIYFTI